MGCYTIASLEYPWQKYWNIQPSFSAKFSLVSSVCCSSRPRDLVQGGAASPEAAWWFVVVGLLPLIAPVLAFVDAIRTRLWLDEGLLREPAQISSADDAGDGVPEGNAGRARGADTGPAHVGYRDADLESLEDSHPLVVADIDNPQKAADAILRAGRRKEYRRIMSDFLNGKIAVVTGASRGLGRAMGVALSQAGVRVALVGRDVRRSWTRQRGSAAMARRSSRVT